MPNKTQETGGDEFEVHRGLLEGIAYRMCGVVADAQDIVQETHLKWCSAERSGIRNARAWLVTVCSRLAMDVMKSARVRREQYAGVWLPEPFLESHRDAARAREQMDDSVSVALMLAMERLTPFERAAFLLHDVFGYRFDEVASILEQSEAACRKSASRARKSVQEKRSRFKADPEMHRRLLEAFFEAVHGGEPGRLKALLAGSVEFHSDGGGLVKTAPAVLSGREAVAAFFLEIWRENVPSRDSVKIVDRWFNGGPGVLIQQGGRLVAAVSLELERDGIARIFALRNPEKLVVFSRTRRLASAVARNCPPGKERNFAVRGRIADTGSGVFTFPEHKTMYGGRHIAEGDTVFVFSDGKESGEGLVACAIVTSALAIPKKPGIARQTPRVSVSLERTALVKRRLGRGELRPFSGREEGRPESEIHFKLYRETTDKIVGLSDAAAAFLQEFF